MACSPSSIFYTSTETSERREMLDAQELLIFCGFELIGANTRNWTREPTRDGHRDDEECETKVMDHNTRSRSSARSM